MITIWCMNRPGLPRPYDKVILDEMDDLITLVHVCLFLAARFFDMLVVEISMFIADLEEMPRESCAITN